MWGSDHLMTVYYPKEWRREIKHSKLRRKIKTMDEWIENHAEGRIKDSCSQTRRDTSSSWCDIARAILQLSIWSANPPCRWKFSHWPITTPFTKITIQDTQLIYRIVYTGLGYSLRIFLISILAGICCCPRSLKSTNSPREPLTFGFLTCWFWQ